MATGGKTGKAVAVSYDLMGNPIQVPQNQFDYNAQYAQQAPTNYNMDVGNGQWVNQGLNTGSDQQYIPLPPQYTQDYNPSQAYSQNPDGSFAINTGYINNNLSGGVRGFDAYDNYNQNTNRPYSYEGLYGTNVGQGNMTFQDGGEISPTKASKILHDGTINGKKITDKQRKYFGAMSNKANGGTIEIDPSHRGRFSDWASTHGMTVDQATSKVLGNPGRYSTEVEKMAQFARNIGKADDGARFNNPFIDWNQPYQPQYNDPATPQMAAQNWGYNPSNVQQTDPRTYIDNTQTAFGSNSYDSGYTQSNGSLAGGIQSGVQAVGGLFSAANNLRNQVILGGGALINGLLPDHHNIRQRSPVMADQTLAYQPQYNNMLENGGNMQQAGPVVNTAYLKNQVVDLSPEEAANLKKAGYTFSIIG